MEKKSGLQFLSDIEIKQYKTDVGFRTLVEGVDENLYIIPKYQRKYRWSKEQVVALVESLICGFPIPPIYTCRNEYNQLEILDGQQRVMSLFFYYIGYYINKKKKACINFSGIDTDACTFREALLGQADLDELHIQLKVNHMPENMDYKDLPIELKRRVDYVPITVIEIKIDNENRKPAVLRQIFANLNRGGSLLTAQELRNGVYSCEFYNMLQMFNGSYQPWRDIWGREDAKEQDMEALLRLCALKRFVSVKNHKEDYSFVVEGYQSSYVELLDRFSEEAMTYDDQTINEYKNSLTDFISLFQISRKMSSKITLLESLYVNFEKKGMNKVITDEIYNNIVDDIEYTSRTRQGTVQMKKMNERWKAVYEIWNRCAG